MTVLFRILFGAVGVGCLLMAYIAIMTGINRFTLRKGGTDPQWLWFPGPKDSPGRQRLKEDEAAAAVKAKAPGK